MICGVILLASTWYLMDFLNSTIEKIDWENKFYIILGDLNFDLLKLDSHPETEDFLDTIGSFSLQPHILQPTRFTDHS